MTQGGGPGPMVLLGVNVSHVCSLCYIIKSHGFLYLSNKNEVTISYKYCFFYLLQ